MIVLLIFFIIISGASFFIMFTKINGHKFNKRLRRMALIGAIIGVIGAVGSMAIVQHQQDAKDAATIKAQQDAIKKKKKKAELAKIEKQKKEQEADMSNKQTKDKLEHAETRELTAQQYALEPNTIYNLYNKSGQSFFDTQYAKSDERNYALKHIGLYMPNLQFHTFDNQTATIDNLPKKKRKVVFLILPKITTDNSSTLAAQMQLFQGSLVNYPDVSFITVFPDNNNKDVDNMLKSNQVNNYGIIVTKDGNDNIGGNYGSINTWAHNILGLQNSPIVLALDQSDRLALVENDPTVLSQDYISRFVNIAFNSLPGEKPYNMLKSKKEVAKLTAQGNQAFNADSNGNEDN